MKVLALLGLLATVLAAPSPSLEPEVGDLEAEMAVLDPEENDSIEQFEEHFHLPKITDPEELARRVAALAEAEAVVKEENVAFLAGNKTWFDAINEFSDLPKDEFEAHKTGLVSPYAYARGLLEPAEEDRWDDISERYFAALRADPGVVPASYSSVTEGLVSEVKNQRDCGSCAAFASMAAIETCFKKVTGVFGDYSEQQLVDCGYGKSDANGCNGAPIFAYPKIVADDAMDLTAEANYPYKNENTSYTCPADLKQYNQGAKVTGSYYTYEGDEDLLKTLVAKNGAVVTSLRAEGSGGIQGYKGGVYAGCTSTTRDHAVTVVGYGTDPATGMDYWLIKNSWGNWWGENGYIRVQRGVGMCGVGKDLATVECSKVDGPTDAPIIAEAPCFDRAGNCADYVENSCHDNNIARDCQKSCGLCPGMSPAPSNTCFDVYTNCATLAKTQCWVNDTATKCQKSCGLCPGMTPAPSNTCYDIGGPDCAHYVEDCQSENIRSQCKKTCGACPDTAPSTSTTSSTTHTTTPTPTTSTTTTALTTTTSTTTITTTAADSSTPCYDQLLWGCAFHCSNDIIANNQCKKTCGKCETMTTTTPSPTCEDQLPFCSAFHCWSDFVANNQCKKTCGKCETIG